LAQIARKEPPFKPSLDQPETAASGEADRFRYSQPQANGSFLVVPVRHLA
jgi:hypothetical protein